MTNIASSTALSGKAIPVVLDGEPGVNQCPYIDWFRFSQCTIKTCKNYSEKTKTRCLGIDREVPVSNKIISDAEIHLFKFSHESVSTRLVSMRRKKAVARVKLMLTLHGYISWIAAKYGSSAEANREWHAPQLGVVESAYPLKVRHLGFKNWMWRALLNEKEFAKFTSERAGECSEIGITDLLNIDAENLNDLRRVIAVLAAPKEAMRLS